MGRRSGLAAARALPPAPLVTAERQVAPERGARKPLSLAAAEAKIARARAGWWLRPLLVELAAAVVLVALVLAAADTAQQAWLAAPVLLAVAAAGTTWWRRRHRPAGRRILQRLLTAGAPLLLLPHLPAAAPDLARDVGMPRLVLIAVPALCCVLLAARAATVPARSAPVARSAAAALLSLFLLVDLAAYHQVLPSTDGAVLVEMPVQGEWFALQAGRSLLTNHHVLVGDQGHAVDLVRRLPGGTTRSGPAQQLESYAAYGGAVTAPAAGQVVAVRDGQPDQPIGRSDAQQPDGNSITLRLGDEQYVLLAHLRPGTIRVQAGQFVQVGQQLAEVGNSGNTSEPHVHLQAMTARRDGKPLRLQFPGAQVKRAGRTFGATPTELRRNDRIAATRSGTQQARS